MTGSHESSPERQAIARRPSVRIVERRKLPRAAKMSLITAIAASGVAFAAWRWWRPEPANPVYHRSVADVDLTWKCEAGHTFIAAGQIEPRSCAMCDQPAFPITTYECKLHGSYEVAVRFAADPDGSSKVSQIRLLTGDWFPATADLPCPKCGQPLTRKATDPFARSKKPRP